MPRDGPLTTSRGPRGGQSTPLSPQRQKADNRTGHVSPPPRWPGMIRPSRAETMEGLHGLGLPVTSSSLQLLRRAQLGDKAALELLLERYLPRLRRWARG